MVEDRNLTENTNNNERNNSFDDEECKHLDSVKVKALEKKLKSLIPNEIKCLTCSSGESSPKPSNDPPKTICLCLYCVETHCGRSEKQHAVQHSKDENHSISLNLETYEAWCYKCDQEVVPSTGRNQVVAQAQAEVRKHFKVEDVNEATEPETTTPTLYRNWRNPIHVTAPGLTNLGNTCFFNSVMQVVVATSELHDVLTPSDLYHTLPHIDGDKCVAASCEDVGPLTNAFKEFLREMWRTRSSIVTPADLFNQITKKWQQFRGWRQQDSQELMRFLFDGVKSEELELIKKLQLGPKMVDNGEDVEDEEVEDDSDMEKKDEKKYASFIDACFGGKLVSVIVCDVCKKCSYSYEEFLDVSLPIKSSDDQFKSKTNSFGYDYGYGYNSLPFSGNSFDFNKNNESGSCRTQSDEGTDHEGEDSENQNEEVSSDIEVEEGIPVPSKEERKRIRLLLRDLPSDSGQSTPNSKDQNVTLRDCLKSFVKVETLEGDNSFACDNCWKLKKEHDERVARKRTSTGDDKQYKVNGKTDVMMNSQDTQSEDVNMELQNNQSEDVNMESQNNQSEDMDGVQYTTAEPVNNANDDTISSNDKENSSDTSDGSSDKVGSTSNDNSYSHRDYNSSTSYTMDSSPTISKPVSQPEQKYILRKAYKRYLFDSLPPVMVFHLKRFQQVGGRWSVSMRKIDDFVAFDEELDVGDFVVPPEIEENDGINNGNINGVEPLPNQNNKRKFSTKYRLYGVVVHLGSLYNGHYISYVLSRNIRSEGEQYGMGLSFGSRANDERQKHKTDDQRQWIYCSDSSVRSTSVDDALNSGAYLLFYERVYE